MSARTLLAVASIALVGASSSSGQTPVVDPEYARVTNDRADKIVATLGVNDDAERTRIRDLIANWYRTLSRIHDAKGAGALAADKAAEEQLAAHRRFVAQLEARLTPEQVELVKDGLTYGVVPRTYQAYLELLPALTAEQKAEIKSQLLEAREFALDAGSADEKHAWFGKYKGRINNYLSQAGYDLKQAERDRGAE